MIAYPKTLLQVEGHGASKNVGFLNPSYQAIFDHLWGQKTLLITTRGPTFTSNLHFPIRIQVVGQWTTLDQPFLMTSRFLSTIFGHTTFTSIQFFPKYVE